MSSSDEWYTPQDVIDMVTELLGDYFDPCGQATSPATAGARRYFDIRQGEDALTLPWPAMPVFLNPPYSNVGPFVDALLRAAPPAAVVLVNASTAAKWFQRLLGASAAVLFPSPRIRFLRHSAKGLEQPTSPRYNNALLYLGDDPEGFLRTFAPLGRGAILEVPE